MSCRVGCLDDPAALGEFRQPVRHPRQAVNWVVEQLGHNELTVPPALPNRGPLWLFCRCRCRRSPIFAGAGAGAGAAAATACGCVLTPEISNFIDFPEGITLLTICESFNNLPLNKSCRFLTGILRCWEINPLRCSTVSFLFILYVCVVLLNSYCTFCLYISSGGSSIGCGGVGCGCGGGSGSGCGGGAAGAVNAAALVVVILLVQD